MIRLRGRTMQTSGKIGYAVWFVALIVFTALLTKSIFGNPHVLGLIVSLILCLIGTLLIRQDPAVKASGFFALRLYTTLPQKIGFALFIGGSYYVTFMAVIGYYPWDLHGSLLNVLSTFCFIAVIVGVVLWLAVRYE
jgi:hypothetical protein